MLERARPFDREAIDPIFAGSALADASRHALRSKVDLIDRIAMVPDYHVELTAEDFSSGVFAHRGDWPAVEAGRCGLVVPYANDRGATLRRP